MQLTFWPEVTESNAGRRPEIVYRGVVVCGQIIMRPCTLFRARKQS